MGIQSQILVLHKNGHLAINTPHEFMNDISGLFVFFAGLAILAGIASSPIIGPAGIFSVLVACYFMLVSANAIDRGARGSKRKRKK